MNEDKVVRNLLINEGASYTVNGGKLTVLGFIKNIENTPANFIFTDGAQLIHNNTGVLATMKKTLQRQTQEIQNGRVGTQSARRSQTALSSQM